MKDYLKIKDYLKVTDVDVPIYGGKLVIIFTNSIEMLKERIPQYTNDDIWAHSVYMDYNDKHGYTIVLNFDNEFTAVTHGTIAHEAFHVANMIGEIVGIIPDLENDEALAYLIQWITDEVYKVINKNGYKVKWN